MMLPPSCYLSALICSSMLLPVSCVGASKSPHFKSSILFSPETHAARALADDVEPGESSSERAIKPKSQVAQHHLENNVLGEKQAVDISGRDQSIRLLSPNAVPASNMAASAMPTCSGVSEAAISVMLIDNPRKVFHAA